MKPPWKTMETNQKPWKTWNHLEKPWKPTRNHEKPWNHLKKWYVANTGSQLTSFGAKTLPSPTRGPNQPFRCLDSMPFSRTTPSVRTLPSSGTTTWARPWICSPSTWARSPLASFSLWASRWLRSSTSCWWSFSAYLGEHFLSILQFLGDIVKFKTAAEASKSHLCLSMACW